jgi:hypothetical protein
MNAEGRSDSKGYQTEDGSGVGLLENVGKLNKLNMMLRRKNACCLGRNRNRGQGAPTRGNRGRRTGSSNRVPSSGESYKPDRPGSLKTVALSPGTERCYGAGGEEMAPSSLHLTDGVPRCPSRTT